MSVLTSPAEAGRAMNVKRTTIIFVAAVAFAAWFSAAMTPGRPPAASHEIQPAAIDASGAALASEIARLRERLRPDATPRAGNRNPFVFRSREYTRPAPRMNVPAEPPKPDVPTEPTRSTLSLAGIAEDPDPAGNGVARTAIIAGNGQVFLAKEGDTVTDRDVTLTVTKISADGAELIDPRDGSTRRLRMK
jgi:hypothetical protein